jgi:hypothetical protein
MTYVYEIAKECKVCDMALPEGREDENCEDCRAYRIIERRLRRGKVALEPNPVEFARHA